jgi:Pyridoxamine 5'-phosphate oxidase
MTMRRKDREISEEEALHLLAKGEYGVLSTVGPDGSPYGVPLSYIYREGEIYFHSAIEGRKVEHLCAGALASFCVVGATEILPESSARATRARLPLARSGNWRARIRIEHSVGWWKSTRRSSPRRERSTSPTLKAIHASSAFTCGTSPGNDGAEFRRD